ncbi:unnamed protein product [Prunus armeniaca]
MGKSQTDLPSRNNVRPTPCFGRITGAKQPHAFHGPATWPSSHRGRPDPSWPKQRDHYFVIAVRSEQSDCFTITCVVIAVWLPPSVRFGHSNNNTYAPWSNLRRLSSAAQLGRNGLTPHPSGPVERGATSFTADCGPTRSAPLGAPI